MGSSMWLKEVKICIINILLENREETPANKKHNFNSFSIINYQKHWISFMSWCFLVKQEALLEIDSNSTPESSL